MEYVSGTLFVTVLIVAAFGVGRATMSSDIRIECISFEATVLYGTKFSCKKEVKP